MSFPVRFILIFVLIIALIALVIAVVVLWSRRSEKKRAAKAQTIAEQERSVYDRFKAEMMAYASQPDVVLHEEAFVEPLFVRTVVDRFGKRCYVEKQRTFDQALHCTLCLFENGSWIPSKSVVINIPATQVEWSAYHRNIRDIREHGAKFSFQDKDGLNRQVRVRCEPAELRV